MTVKFPVFALGGTPSAGGADILLKSKIGDAECLLLFSCNETARDFLANRITRGGENLEVVRLDIADALPAFEKSNRLEIERIVIDLGSDTEQWESFSQVLAYLRAAS